MLFFFKD